jgi:hypothetical protein
MRLLSLIAILALGACAHSTQLTSGAEYLAATGPGIGAIDAGIAAVAAVEPNLHFPARIGVARVVNGALSTPTAEEAEGFAALAQRQSGLGAFVPVSPLVAAMVAPAREGSGVIADIRLAAARQHLDYLLVYEIGVRSAERDTPFAIADVTLIGGAFLPTRSIRVAGVGQAMLIDVRNGYPYGTASAIADLSGLARSFGTDRRQDALRERATVKVAEVLLPEIEAMLVDLAAQVGR